MATPKNILESLRSHNFHPIVKDDILKYGFIKAPKYHFSGLTLAKLNVHVEMIAGVISRASCGISDWCPIRLHDYTNGSKTVMVTESSVADWLWSRDTYVRTSIENPLHGTPTLYARKGYDPVKHRIYVSRLVCTMIVDGYMAWWNENKMSSMMLLPLVSKEMHAAIKESKRDDWHLMFDDFDSETCWILECLQERTS